MPSPALPRARALPAPLSEHRCAQSCLEGNLQSHLHEETPRFTLEVTIAKHNSLESSLCGFGFWTQQLPASFLREISIQSSVLHEGALVIKRHAGKNAQ